MPLPSPKKDEEQDDFIERCMSNDTVKEDFPDNDQRLGVCFSQWKKKEDKLSKKRDELEYRSFPLTDIEIREDETPKIMGYAAVFDKLSVPLWGFREKISQGAFAKTIRKADIRALWNHDANEVLGRTKNKTLFLEEDDKGLRIEITPPDTQLGRDVTELIKRGDVDQMSFAFDTVKESWEEAGTDKAIRTLEEVNLFDVSPVTFPAYPQTSIKVRSMLEDTGFNIEAISGLLVRAQKGLPLTQTDYDLINSSISILNNYLPAVEPASQLSVNEAPVRLDILKKQLEIANL